MRRPRGQGNASLILAGAFLGTLIVVVMFAVVDVYGK